MQEQSSISQSALKPDEITSVEQLKVAFAHQKGWDAQYRLIIKLGKTLATFPEEMKVEHHQIKGCESLAWMLSNEVDGVYDFKMDSDTRVVRGLMKIILIIFQHKTQQEINEIDCEQLFSQFGLMNHLSPSRANGLFAIINKIQGA